MSSTMPLAEAGLSSPLHEWERFDFELSEKPLVYTGRFHRCGHELKIALVRIGRHTIYAVICYQCCILWPTGVPFHKTGTSNRVSNRSLLEAASTWKGGWK